MYRSAAFVALSVALGLSLASPGASRAADPPAAPHLEASVIAGITTDYVFRGVSLSGEKPTALLWVEAAYGAAYFNGLLVGNELGEDALGRNIGSIEADATVGIKPTIGNVTLNLGLKFTGYPGGRDVVVGTLIARERDFIEYLAGVKVELTDGVSLGGTAYWTPDFYYETGEVRTLEAEGAIALPSLYGLRSRFTATVGKVESEARDVVSPGHGYTYVGAGIEGQLDHLVFDLRYWNTDVREIAAFDQRLVLSVGLKIP